MRNDAYVCRHSCSVIRFRPASAQAAVARAASLPDMTETGLTSASRAGRPARMKPARRMTRRGSAIGRRPRSELWQQHTMEAALVTLERVRGVRRSAAAFALADAAVLNALPPPAGQLAECRPGRFAFGEGIGALLAGG